MFHVMRHLGEALDKVHKAEYARLAGQDRRFIKGQKYTLLSRQQNLTEQGRKSLKKLLAANRRQHGVLSQGVFRSTLELAARGVGKAILRELAREPEGAEVGTVREVRSDDRSTSGRDRYLLQAGEQGVAGLRLGDMPVRIEMRKDLLDHHRIFQPD